MQKLHSVQMQAKECHCGNDESLSGDACRSRNCIATTEQVDEAVEAGAKFIVSPGLNPDTVEYCVKKGIPILPGCSSPSDIEQAIKYGLDVVKFFPAEAAGGLKAIKAMAAPYSQIRFMPTGGINPSQC